MIKRSHKIIQLNLETDGYHYKSKFSSTIVANMGEYFIPGDLFYIVNNTKLIVGLHTVKLIYQKWKAVCRVVRPAREFYKNIGKNDFCEWRFKNKWPYKSAS